MVRVTREKVFAKYTMNKKHFSLNSKTGLF